MRWLCSVATLKWNCCCGSRSADIGNAGDVARGRMEQASKKESLKSIKFPLWSFFPRETDWLTDGHLLPFYYSLQRPFGSFFLSWRGKTGAESGSELRSEARIREGQPWIRRFKTTFAACRKRALFFVMLTRNESCFHFYGTRLLICFLMGWNFRSFCL